MPSIRTTALLLSLLTLCAAAETSPVLPTQPEGGAEPGQLAEPSLQAEPGLLTDTPFEMVGLGLSFRLPVGATATGRRIGTEHAADVVGPNASYRISMSTKASANAELTAEQAAGAILESLQNAVPQARLLRPVGPVQMNEGAALRFALQLPALGDGGETVRAVAVVGLGRGRMLVWDGNAEAGRGEQLLSALDAMLGSVGVDDPSRSADSRGVALTTGARVLSGLGTEALATVFQDHGERWYRLWQPGAGAAEATEVGYRRVIARPATRSEMNPKSRGTPDPTRGLLVTVEARTLGPATGSAATREVYDSKGSYWVSEDLSQEAWELVVAVRASGQTNTFTEIGVREGFEQLLVSTQSQRGPLASKQHTLEREGYLPVALALLLPQILVEAAVPGDFGFYTYRSDSGSVSYRDDILRQTDAGWSLVSRLGADNPDLTRTLDGQGRLVLEMLPDGKRWEPIEAAELLELWQRKGLPTR